MKTLLISTRSIHRKTAFAVVFLFACTTSIAIGQEALVLPNDNEIQAAASAKKDAATDASAETVVPDQVTPAKIKELQTQIESATDLDDAAKAAVSSVLLQATEELTRSAKFEATAKQDRTAVQAVPSRLETLEAEIEATKDKSLQLPPPTATLTELESRVASLLAQTQEARNRLTTLQSDLTRRVDRRKQIALLQASHAQRVTEAEQQLAVDSPSGESPWAASARRLLQLAKLQSLALELPAYQWELARYDAEQAVDLPDMKVKQAQSEVESAEAAIAALNQRIDTMRKSQARSRVNDLSKLAESIESPELRTLALRNTELAEEDETVVSNIGKVSADAETARKRFDDLRIVEERTRERFSRIGMSGAIGLELRKQLSLLPDVREIHRQGLTRQELMRDVELKRLNYEDDADAAESESLDPNASGLEKQIQSDYLTTLQSLSKNYNKYFQQLSELDFAENHLIVASEEYRTFLNEHVLWIRSNGFFDWQSITDAVEGFSEIARPASWADVGRSIWIDAFTRPWLYGLGSLALLLMMPARYRGRKQLIEFGKIAERPTCTEFSVTVRAAMMTVIMAIVWPAVLLFLGWRLIASPLSVHFPMSVGRGLVATAAVLMLLNVVRHACREHGLAASHFGWPARVTDLLRRTMRMQRFLLLPFVFVVTMLRELGGLDTNNALERLCMACSLVILAWALYQILHPRHGAMAEYLRRNPNAWFARTSNLWTWAIILFPCIMTLLIVSGFYYTATELTWRFWHTIWLAVTLVAIRAFAIRALQINHRRVRIQKMKERRAAQAQLHAAALAAGNAPAGSAPAAPVEQAVTSESLSLESEHDALRVNSEQVLRILHSSLLMSGLVLMWLLWSGLFPAFGILDQVKLWDTEREVVVETPAADGGMTRTTETRIENITLINVLAAVVIAVVTFTLVRNVPGLIEIAILQRLPLEASFKFAIVTMTRYAILVVGILLSSSAIGASWAKLQWLVAALTVGLGFGLQEIFGNFVSGIIILWERPIRIGDVVTLDGVSGTVSRIQMRATTISDWDRKEYIVPNKDFVTGRLLNWTRSDQVSRIVIPIGVAYGSDVRKALTLLLQVAAEHPRILNEPPASATFDNFGDSTLNLSMRCFIPNLDGRLDTISELNLAIDDTFAQAGIEIAFPQQDLHIRSAPDGWQLPTPSQPTDT
ncbi:mechanosensitive ion channel domain-containing protein [Rubripirellula tenax]|nr:mechanosensitive ion channel domain-containing protein [Rubripirellula tenax]